MWSPWFDSHGEQCARRRDPEPPLTGKGTIAGLDANYLEIRQSGRIVTDTAKIAVAANTEGRHDNIGLSLLDRVSALHEGGGLGSFRPKTSEELTDCSAAISLMFEGQAPRQCCGVWKFFGPVAVISSPRRETSITRSPAGSALLFSNLMMGLMASSIRMIEASALIDTEAIDSILSTTTKAI